MFSLDLIIASALPIILEFIIANKFSLLAIFYSLDKIAKMTKTTVDDSIITLFKNIFLRLIGKGNIVDRKFKYLEDNGLVNNVDPLEIKKASEEFDVRFKPIKIDEFRKIYNDEKEHD
jgi:hypothetical protein